MKKLIVMLLVGFTSCGPSKEQMETGKTEVGTAEYSGGIWTSVEYKIEQKTIDSCEYIIIFGANGRNIIHKENCKYCKAKNK